MEHTNKTLLMNLFVVSPVMAVVGSALLSPLLSSSPEPGSGSFTTFPLFFILLLALYPFHLAVSLVQWGISRWVKRQQISFILFNACGLAFSLVLASRIHGGFAALYLSFVILSLVSLILRRSGARPKE